MMTLDYNPRILFLTGIAVLNAILYNSIPTLLVPVFAQDKSTSSLSKSVSPGFSFLERGLVNQAITEFERALTLNPRSLDVRLGLAMAYQQAGRDADAFRSYQAVLDIDSSNETALRALGTLGSYRPEWQSQGITALSILLQTNPQDQEALTQRALLYSYQGRFDQAVADYAVVLQNAPSPETVLHAAEAFTFNGNYSQGLQLFNRYQNSGFPLQGSATIAYALAEREIGDPALAVEILFTELQQNDENNSVTLQQRGALAASYAANGQLEQAEATLIPLLRRQDSRLTLARAYNELWRYSQNLNYAREAAVLYQEILAQPSQYVTFGVAKEVAYALGGMPKQESLALQVYRQLTTQQSDDMGLWFQRTVLEKQLGYATTDDLKRILQTLQGSSIKASTQRSIAQGLVRLDPPEPDLLPLYQILINNGVQESLLHYRVAQIYIDNKDYRAARAALVNYSNTSVGTDRLSSGLLLLADIERREANYIASAEIYDAILSSRPINQSITIAALAGYAEVLEAQEKYREAFVLYDQLITQTPQPTTAQILHHTRLAYLAKATSKAEAEALLVRSFNEKAALEAADVFAQGELAIELQRPTLAQQAYEILLNVQPDNVDALMALAGLSYSQQRFNEAIGLYRQVLQQESDNLAAQTALVSLSQGFLYKRGLQPPWERY